MRRRLTRASAGRALLRSGSVGQWAVEGVRRQPTQVRCGEGKGASKGRNGSNKEKSEQWGMSFVSRVQLVFVLGRWVVWKETKDWYRGKLTLPQ